MFHAGRVLGSSLTDLGLLDSLEEKHGHIKLDTLLKTAVFYQFQSLQENRSVLILFYIIKAFLFVGGTVKPISLVKAKFD